MLPFRASTLVSSALLFIAALPSLGCEAYDGVPHATIVGSQSGVLTDAKKPLQIRFDKAVEPSTLKLEIANLAVDQEGNLGDEDTDGMTELNALFAYDGAKPTEVVGGTLELSEGDTLVTIRPDNPFPVAEKLVLLLEPGLSDTAGHKYIVRDRMPFTYKVNLTCVPSADFHSGAYFFLADVTKPIGVQVQLLANIEVNPMTGELVGNFVNADRNRDVSRCTPFGLSCNEKTEACRTLPMPACVPPSEKAASPDEYPDYLPNYDPPAGFDFNVKGCIDGSGDKIVFVNVPVDVAVQSPQVKLKGTVVTATFTKDDKGVLRGQGSIAAEQVLFGPSETDTGKAEGTATARDIPPGEVPPGLKKPAAGP